ncbi:MAG: helix-turn-helix domain-containing protein [Erysipelotrichales bacterium]|nr:helix-turn-helix domain-containing protein [Erysipelotrichales bacterium]
MKFRYYLIGNATAINPEEYAILIDILKGFFVHAKMEIKENLIVIYDDLDNVDGILDLIDNLNSELYLDLKIFCSPEYHKFSESYFNWSLKAFKEIESSERFLDEKELLNESFKVQVSEETKKIILKKFYSDSEMLRSVKVFLECDLNVSKASELLYLHRNTLIQRIDRFSEVTGYNIKNFQEAVLIYNLLK